jgi:acyl dehydratase
VSNWALLKVGMSVRRSYHFDGHRVMCFAHLVGDFAPVHMDHDFAIEQGFSGRIVHGLFVQSIISGLLGEGIPGKHSVINTVSIKIHRPVLVGETVDYEVKIVGITPSVRALSLSFAGCVGGQTTISGKVLCSFPVSSGRIHEAQS